jgi:hypothetical protein
MKKIVYAVFAACALVPAAHALTGAQAAQLITSEPSDAYYVTPDTFELAWAYYDGGELKSTSFTIGTDSWQDDVEAAVSSLKNTVNSVALDACMALAKIEALREVDAYLNSRVDVLTDSVKNAMSQLDEVKQTDEKQDHEIETVDAKISPPDGDTIVKVGDDPGVLALRGFSGAGGSEWYVPHPRGGVLAWDSLISLFDGKTISSETAAYSPFGLTFGLKGWETPTASPGACGDTLAYLLHGTDPGPHYVLTKCGNALHYTPIGELADGGAPVDNLSLTTNETSGAVTQGAVSLYGWNDSDTKSGYIPSKGDSVLKWLDPASMVDNSSLALTTTDGGKVWEVNGAHTYAGNHGRHYFGTGDDSSLGWHELPNVTTNNVVGDELSISSTGDGDQKVFSLRGWPPAAPGVPYAIGSQGGALAYFPLPELLTNGLACVCSNRWEALYDWLGDGSSSDAHGIDFTTEGIGKRVHDLGFLKTNDLDNVSLGVSDDGKTQIGGFASAMRCNARLSSMLKDPNGEDAGKHLLLANYDAGGGVRHLHYVSIGEGIKEASGDMVDGVSIVTNGGKIALYGYGANASKGKFLKHGADTGVEWVDVPTNEVDDASVEVVGGKLQIAGFDQAEPDSVPRKADGRIVWSGASSATNTYVAGSYISMTDNGGGVVTVSAQSKTLDVITGISFAFNGNNQLVATVTKQTITVLDKATQTTETTATIPLWKQDVVIGSEYSTSTHAFKNTTLGGVRTVETLPSQPSQTTVFTATAHSGQ